MTDYTLSEDERRLLTKVLGECWNPMYIEGVTYCPACPVCRSAGHNNRKFDTHQDAGELAVRLVELGLWNQFDDFAYELWDWSNSFSAWLMTNPQRFCKLVVTCPAVRERFKEEEV